MNNKQFFEHIGNIDDRLVEQAEKIPNYSQLHYRKVIKRFISVAAALALMVSSFSAGAFVFARETVVEVPIKQETVTLEEICLTLNFPNEWKGKYSVEKDGQNYIVYHTQIREDVSTGIDAFDGGVLFYIVCYEESMTPEQFIEKGYDFVSYRYLFSTSDKTYILCYPSDVQWNPENSEQETEYLRMEAEIKDIKFVVDNILTD
ncbi:MAG: hypothetical protein K2J67_03085 [Lachnospiraceae bacterium]|nr:hypothetical protein [Lachnospiraceae bacterium]